MRSPQASRIRDRATLAVFFLCFGVFVANILLGKSQLAFGWNELPLLNDVAEFLLLLVSMVIFVIAALQQEAARDTARHPENPNQGETT